MKNGLLLIFILTFFSAKAQNYYLLIGTYTSGKSDGIYVYDFNSTTGDAAYVSKIKSANPSYLAIAPNEENVYAVNEAGKNEGRISAYAFNKNTGTLTKLNDQLSDGDDPCYVAVDKTDKWVAVANYTGGSLTIFPKLADGSLGNAATHIQHYGSSINKDRQQKAHVHSTFFSKGNKYLFVQDLGMDEITSYPFDEKTGALDQKNKSVIKSIPGSGPRHIDFSPNDKFAYLMHELDGTVTVYQHKRGKLKPIQNISAAQKGFTGFMGSADIHVSPDGNFLYCSNRGDANTITIFKIDKHSGKLTVIGYQPTLGKAPRNFNFDPSRNFLLVANQNSDNIVIFRIDKLTGLLTDTGKRIDIGNPVCIKWITK